MGLLKSVNDVPGIDYYDYRDSDYYNKYVYRSRFTVPGIRYAWYSDIGALKKRLASKQNSYSSIREPDKSQLLNNLDTVESILKFRDECRKDKTVTIRVEGNTLAVFSNDLSFLKSLEPQFGSGAKFDYTEVVTTSLVGVKHFVNKPKYNFRVYLKSKRAPEGFREELKNFLENNKKSLSPSPAMKQWTQDASQSRYWWSNYLSSYFFIDYDDESTLSYLALMYGDMIGKRYKLEKRPDPV